MTVSPRPSIPSILPESAPFTPEQRTWLDGFFAGFLSLDGAVTALTPEEAAQLMPGVLDGPGAPPAGAGENDDDIPWHDQSLPMGERMKLAEGRSLRQRLMAAMAQQDCGQCGYNCRDYSHAIFTKTEERLNLCVPGGKETARMVKALHEEIGKTPAPAPAAAPTQSLAPVEAAASGIKPGSSRDHPADATFLSRTRLNKPGSAKETWHVEFDLSESRLDYTVGDAFGVFPTNDPALADAVIAALHAPADFPIGGRTLREVLIDGVSLGGATDTPLQLYRSVSGG